MRICFVYEYYFPHIGGGEILIQRLAEGLVQRGHQASLVTTLLPGTSRREQINGVDIHRVAVPRVADRYWFTFLSYPKISQVSRDADIIQVATYNGAVAAWVAAHRGGKPVVLFPFEVLGSLWMNIGLNPLTATGFMLFEKIIMRLPYDGYSCISRYTMNSLLKASRIPEEKAFLAYPGIDYDLFDPSSNDRRDEIRSRLGVGDGTFLCIYTGRPGVVKGVEYLIKAAPEIRKRVPGARILLLLSRRPANKYKEALALISKMDPDLFIIKEQVARNELPYYFQAGDCVVIPSLNEGFGFTCVEACAMGKPVVATNAGSLPEVISGSHVMVPPMDPMAIARGVERVHQGRSDYTEPKRFTWDECIDAHLDAYSRLVEKKRAG